MRHRAMFLFLGTIVATQTNGLSLYKKGKEEGRVSGGNIGDAVVREKQGGPTDVKIIPEEEWEAMPKDEKTVAEIEEASKSGENLRDELAKAKNKIAELEEELKKARESLLKDKKSAKKEDGVDNQANKNTDENQDDGLFITKNEE